MDAQIKLREELESHRKSHIRSMLECEELRSELSKLTTNLSNGRESNASLQEEIAALQNENEGLLLSKGKLSSELSLVHSEITGVFHLQCIDVN